MQLVSANVSETSKLARDTRLANLTNTGKGRPKGVPNKVNAQIKEMIVGALDNAGGIDYLTERAQDPRTASAFLTLVGKVLPLQVTGENGEAIKTSVTLNVVGIPGNPTP